MVSLLLLELFLCIFPISAADHSFTYLCLVLYKWLVISQLPILVEVLFVYCHQSDVVVPLIDTLVLWLDGSHSTNIQHFLFLVTKLVS